ncbi:hypothetical protein ASF44_06430 [Pseudorhodoferax sp. Leaf274]|nr:hypothetical protein ASF44_06430 [Pseudorhodoferax sp. Leaf274]
MKSLAAHYSIHWVSFDTTTNDVEAGKTALREFCASVTTVPLPAPQPRWRLRARQLLGGPPVPAQVMESREMEDTIKTVIARSSAIAALFQFPQVAQYIRAGSAVPTIMDTQDVSTVSIYRQWRKAGSTKRRIIDGLNWLSWARYEMRHYATADLLLALSETDAGVLRAFWADVPCVLSPVATEVPPQVARGPGSYVAMVGNYFHPPNVDGLHWLLSEVWPQVRAQMPDAQLRVAGPQCPPQTPELLAQGVHMTGFVDNIDAFFDGAAVSVCPYRFGGGIKIKVIEALARACPVVATSVGAEGLGAVDGQHLAVANGTRAFADAIVSLLRDPATARNLGESGRAHVAQNFSFQSKTLQLMTEINALAARRRHALPQPAAQAALAREAMP